MVFFSHCLWLVEGSLDAPLKSLNMPVKNLPLTLLAVGGNCPFGALMFEEMLQKCPL